MTCAAAGPTVYWGQLAYLVSVKDAKTSKSLGTVVVLLSDTYQGLPFTALIR